MLHIDDILLMLAAFFSGAVAGSYLVLNLIYKPVLTDWLNSDQGEFIYRRFYRLNTVLALLGGFFAALAHNRETALVLAVLAASYVFAHVHILKALVHNRRDASTGDRDASRVIGKLLFVQQAIHVAQFLAAFFAFYTLIRVW